MALTRTTQISGTAASSRVSSSPVVPEPLCWFCTEEDRYGRSLGRASEGIDAATVRFGGTLACSWHACFYFAAQPAQLWRELSA